MIKEAIDTLVSGKSLAMEQAGMVMEEIMSGETTPAQFGAFVTALRLKGETVQEIAGMARVMRERAIPVAASGPLVDTCGTGGDGSQSFNISTTAAFVVAGAGLKVAKHGNRSMSSSCGSADVLEALGVKIDLGAKEVEKCLEEVGIGFMFAPIFHPAMKYASAPRREIGIRTVFNILGPLTNPAGASAQMLGIADRLLTVKMAEVLKLLGSHHALVVHGEDGLDEITLDGQTTVCELNNGVIKGYYINPAELGFSRVSKESLRGGSPQENADILIRILKGEKGPHRDIVLMNAAAALVAGDRAQAMKEGLALAKEAIDSGRALEKLEGLIALSQSL
ncbi:MAG: anthranilate phosphoribosyltransferase [Dehalococcoidia bacterium]|nr:anthranilate phosphoribosyltransferase [Dehalococcoidia bacterium]